MSILVGWVSENWLEFPFQYRCFRIAKILFELPCKTFQLGFYKALHPPPIMDPADPVRPSIGPGYHRRSKEEKQLICDKFLRLRLVHLFLSILKA